MLPGIAGVSGIIGRGFTTLAFQGTAGSNTALTEYTFSSQPFGTASAGRVVVVAISATKGTNGTISSVTIGGVSATIVVQASSGSTTCGIAAAIVPSGTTGDVVVTMSTSRNSCLIGIWSSTGVPSSAAVDTGSNTDQSALVLDTVPGGFVVAVCTNQDAETTSWTGATEEYDTSAGTANYSSGAGAIIADSSVTVQPTVTGISTPALFVAATF